MALLTPVVPPATADDGDVSVAIDIPDSAEPEEAVTATITFTNDNDHSVIEGVTVYLAGEKVAEENSVVVPGGGTKTVSLAFKVPVETGQYRVSADSKRDKTGAVLAVTDGPLQNVRIDAPNNATKEKTVALELTTKVYEPIDRLDLEANITGATAVELTAVTVDGTGSIDQQGTENGSVTVSGTGFEPVSTLRVGVLVETPADTSGEINVTATATGGDDRAQRTITLPVVERGPQSTYRSFDEEVRPGETTNVTTNVTVDGPELTITEHVEGAANLSYVDIRLDKPGPYHIWTEANGEWMNVTLGGLENDTTVTLVYEVGVPANASEGDEIRISGNATTNHDEIPLNVSTMFVLSPSPLSPYAGADGRVDTEGLRQAINDWASGEIEIELLQEVIGAWASGAHVD